MKQESEENSENRKHKKERRGVEIEERKKERR